MSKGLKINSIYNLLKTSSSIIYPLITFPYVSRVLQPENVGKVNFAVSFVSYFALLASLGINTYAIRECASVRNSREILSRTASEIFSINIISTLVAYLSLFFTLLFMRRIDQYRSLIIIEASVILFTTVGADWINSALEDFKFIAIRTMSIQVVSIILMFMLVRQQDDYIKYAFICVLANSGGNIVNVFYRRRFCNIKLTFQINWKKHFTPIILLFSMMLSQTIFRNADVTMLGILRNNYEVGIYSVANKMVGLISTIVGSLALVVIPQLSIYFANNDFHKANDALRKVLLYNIGLGLPFTVGTIMLADEIVWLVGGTEFAEGASVMRILIISFMFSLVGGSFFGNAVLIPMRQEKYYMIVCSITAIINVILNALLIPQFGANGAAVATSFNGLLILLLLSVKIDKRIKISNIKEVFKGPIIGCALIVVVCICCRMISVQWLRLVVSIAVSVLTYSAILVVTKNEFGLSVLDFLLKYIYRKS